MTTKHQTPRRDTKRSKDFIRQFDMINKAFVDFEMVEGRKFLPNHSVHKSWAELQASIKGEVVKTKPTSKPRKRKSKR